MTLGHFHNNDDYTDIKPSNAMHLAGKSREKEAQFMFYKDRVSLGPDSLDAALVCV